MSRPKKWDIMCYNSRAEIENFSDCEKDKAIVWADNELRNYRRAMMALVKSNPNWAMGVTEDEEKLISTMIRRAEAI